jgi:exodeoxyribonuclease VII small subunit
MENGRLSLDDSLAAYQRGTQLMQYCQQTLNQAEQQIQVLQGEALQPWSNPDSAS